MLKGVIHVEVETEDIFSVLTRETGEVFTVSREELHADELISFVIDLPESLADGESRLEADPLVHEVRPLTESKLLVKKESAGAIPVILENGGMLHGIDTVYGNDRVFNVLVFHRAHLHTILTELDENVGAADLMKITTVADDTRLLSPRQEEVVRTALHHGYFDWPREIDATELAHVLDISHPTMLEHLRKGEKRLLQWILHETDFGGTAIDIATPPKVDS